MGKARSSNLGGGVGVFLVVCCLGVVAEGKYGGGSGTPEDPYQIRDANHMQAIGADSNDWDKHFKLMADVDLSGFTGEEFNIIGTATYYWYDPFEGPVYIFRPFTGTFRGSGYKIVNFSFTATGFWDYSIGLFGVVDGNDAEVSDLALINPSIRGEGTGTRFGPLVGSLERGTVSRCYVDGGRVSAGYDVGGLVGANEGMITGCHSSCSVAGHARLGGLVGRNYGIVSRSFASGSIDATGYWAGGLVGASYAGSILNSYSTSDVNGVNWRGGFVAENRGSISNCYATGNVPPATGTMIGGFAGYNGITGTISSCFWDVDASGMSTSRSGEGKTTAEMKQRSTFTDWDFINVWDIGENQTYPYLRTVPAGDINKDHVVNFLDLCIVAEQWMKEE